MVPKPTGEAHGDGLIGAPGDDGPLRHRQFDRGFGEGADLVVAVQRQVSGFIANPSPSSGAGKSGEKIVSPVGLGGSGCVRWHLFYYQVVTTIAGFETVLRQVDALLAKFYYKFKYLYDLIVAEMCAGSVAPNAHGFICSTYLYVGKALQAKKSLPA